MGGAGCAIPTALSDNLLVIQPVRHICVNGGETVKLHIDPKSKTETPGTIKIKALPFITVQQSNRTLADL